MAELKDALATTKCWMRRSRFGGSTKLWVGESGGEGEAGGGEELAEELVEEVILETSEGPFGPQVDTHGVSNGRGPSLPDEVCK